MTQYGQLLTIASRTFFDHLMSMAEESLSPFKMNIPTALRDRVADAAKKNRRSMSGEIIYALEKAYPAPKRHTNAGVLIPIIMMKTPQKHRHYVARRLIDDCSGFMDQEEIHSLRLLIDKSIEIADRHGDPSGSDIPEGLIDEAVQISKSQSDEASPAITPDEDNRLASGRRPRAVDLDE